MPLINRDTDYAVRALTRLGRTGEVTAVSELAEAEGAPEVFLRKIMQKLNRAGIVESRQGPFGGYRLSKHPRDVTVLDVLEAVQGPIQVNLCFGRPDSCSKVNSCPLRRHLSRLSQSINGWLEQITLADVSDGAARKRGAGR